MRYLELLREAHPDVMVMYHGTNTSSAANIVNTGGLIPDPPDRNYNGEEDPFHESYPGSYFTDSLPGAVRYAVRSSHEFAAFPAIVVANVPLHQAVPDEDIVNFAVSEALQLSDSANSFISQFHKLLVQSRPIPVANRNLLLTLRRLYKDYHESEGTENAKEYRAAMDKVAHAYSAMVFDTHPRYLGGVHTVRLPNGLPLNNVVSITEFWVADGYKVKNVEVTYGSPGLTARQLSVAISQLRNQGWEP